jgi:hypothetical protein
VLVCLRLFVPFGSTRGTPNTLGYSGVLQGPSRVLFVCFVGTPPIRFDAVVTLVHLATAEDNESVALQVPPVGAGAGACLRLCA